MTAPQLQGSELSRGANREPFDPTRATRRDLRELAALMALPAMWVDHEPADIVSGLIGVLFGVFRLDYAYVRFSGPGADSALERWRPEAMGLPEEFESLAGSGGTRGKEAVTVQVDNPAGPGTLRLTTLSPGLPGEDGLVMVGSHRDDFPTEFELYLLRVAAGQAAISIHTARRMERERNLRIAAEEALHVRNELLGAIAHELSGSLAVLTESAGRARALASESLSPGDPTSSPAGAAKPPRPETVTPAAGPQPRLTRREAEVLGLLAQGLSNKEIAGLMWLSDRTVERHITGLYRKIGVERRSEATAFAMLHGFVRPPAEQA